MKKQNILIFLSILFLLCPSFSNAQKIVPYKDQMYNFGHVGIDFKLFHNYKYINVTQKPVKITKINISCDCSNVVSSDSVVQPGDTVFFKLTFDTKDLFGPTNRSFKVLTDNPQLPEIQYFTRATVGQWFYGLKPNPISIFFLPGKNLQKVTIPNRNFKSIEIKTMDLYDSTFSAKIIKGKASKNKSLEIDIVPNPNLAKGTYQTNLTLTLSKSDPKSDKNEAILTIPIKIVRY